MTSATPLETLKEARQRVASYRSNTQGQIAIWQASIAENEATIARYDAQLVEYDAAIAKVEVPAQRQGIFALGDRVRHTGVFAFKGTGRLTRWISFNTAVVLWDNSDWGTSSVSTEYLVLANS